MRPQLRSHVAHLLRLDRQHDDVAGSHGGVDLRRGRHAELLLQSRQRVGVDIDDMDIGAGSQLAGQAADQGRGHVAAADKGDLQIILHSVFLRKWRCRCAPWWRLRRSPRRGRPTCPSTACRAQGPRARSWSASSRNVRSGRRCAASVAAGSGIVIRPRKRRVRAGRRPRAPAPAAPRGGQPLLLASPLTLTWMQTFSGGSPAGRCSDSRCAIFARSTECTQSKFSAIGRVLLLWIGPMKCHSMSGRAAPSARRSCPALPAGSFRRKRAVLRQYASQQQRPAKLSWKRPTRRSPKGRGRHSRCSSNLSQLPLAAYPLCGHNLVTYGNI